MEEKEKKKRPDLSGLVQTAEEDPKDRERMGKIALWLSNSENPRAPKYIGEIEADEGGSKFRVSVWDNSNNSQKKKDAGGGARRPFLPSKLTLEQMKRGKCWYCGKWLTDKDLVMNYCNECAGKIPSKWEADLI